LWREETSSSCKLIHQEFSVGKTAGDAVIRTIYSITFIIGTHIARDTSHDDMERMLIHGIYDVFLLNNSSTGNVVAKKMDVNETDNS